MNDPNLDLSAIRRERKKLLDQRMQLKVDLTKIESEINNLEDQEWKVIRAQYPELSNYPSLFHALQKTSEILGLQFPVTTYSRDYRFMFIISEEGRGVGIFLIEGKRTYTISLSEGEFQSEKKYLGETDSLEKICAAMNEWHKEKCSASELLSKFSWISQKAS